MKIQHWCLMIAVLGQAACSLPQGGRQGVVSHDFKYPWSGNPPPRTSFEAVISGDRWHFTFDVEDQDIVTSPVWTGESTLDEEDRVEIFFARDPELGRYFCVEIDSLGRVHDYEAKFYRQFESGWQCTGLVTSAERTSAGYRVKGSIPLVTLSDLLGKPVGAGTTVNMGVFRAEFRGRDKSSHGGANDNWISWQLPRTKAPDFHVPSAFKHVKL